MKLTKEIILCAECQFPYYKCLWEPLWLAKKAAIPHHDEWHEAMTEPQKHRLISGWREWERQRIIAMLEEKLLETNLRTEIIALIKGEAK